MRRRGSRAERKVRACLTQNNWLEDGLIRPLNQLPSLSLFSFFSSLCLLFHPLYSFTSDLQRLFLRLLLNLCLCSVYCLLFFYSNNERPFFFFFLHSLEVASSPPSVQSGSILAQCAVSYRNCLWPVLIRCYWIRWGEESISALWITGHLYLCV